MNYQLPGFDETMKTFNALVKEGEDLVTKLRTEDDDSSEEAMRWEDRIEREENSYADRMSEGN